MNTQTAAAALKTAFKKVGHTNVVATDNEVALFHYNTQIITVVDGCVTVNNGGFMTVTTKKFINRALDAIGANAGISQRNFAWYITANGIESTFERSFSFAA